MPSIPTDVKSAIHAGDADRLRELLAADRSRAAAPIRWGRNACIATHPLHYVSDAIFEGILDKAKALPLVEALLAAGAQVIGEVLESKEVRARPEVLAALTGQGSG